MRYNCKRDDKVNTRDNRAYTTPAAVDAVTIALLLSTATERAALVDHQLLVRSPPARTCFIGAEYLTITYI